MSRAEIRRCSSRRCATRILLAKRKTSFTRSVLRFGLCNDCGEKAAVWYCMACEDGHHKTCADCERIVHSMDSEDTGLCDGVVRTYAQHATKGKRRRLQAFCR